MSKIARILWFCILLPTGVFGQEREFSSHGYIDLEFEYDTEEKVSTFDSKHFNIVSTYTFDQFRVFSEIEWEHGTVLEDNPADSEGEVAVERAWLEYVRNDRFKLRAGKFITPFGIYNVIHNASPTFLTTSLPLIYQSHRPFGLGKDRLYGRFYTGLQLLGTIRTHSGIRFWYTVGLGNGRSGEQFSEDNDTNKSLLGQLRLQYKQFNLGFSHYRDRNETGFSGLSEARERSTAADLTFRQGGFKIHGEYARFSMERATGSGFQVADSYYGQISYRIKETITPVIRYDRFDPDRGSPDNRERQLLIGLNVSPHPQVFLKTEIHFNAFQEPGEPSNRLFLSSVSVAF